MMTDDQTDFFTSRWRVAGLMLMSVAFAVVFSVDLYFVRARTQGEWTVGQVAQLFAIMAFGFAAVVIGRGLFRTGVIVSVGRRGIFDRRVSTDWIPWPAVAGVKTAGFWASRHLRLDLNQSLAAALPLRPHVRKRGCFVGVSTLRGGHDAVKGAIDRFYRASDSNLDPHQEHPVVEPQD